jgi:hypothetical protein
MSALAKSGHDLKGKNDEKGQEETHAPQQTCPLDTGSAGSNRPLRKINSAVSVESDSVSEV